MRIIEPGRVAKTNKRRRKSNKSKLYLIVFSVIILISCWLVWSRQKTNDKNNPSAEQSSQAANPPAPPDVQKKLKIFSGEQFRQLMDSFSYPNVKEVVELPIITGDAEADKHIRSLAEARGYRQRAIPNTSLVKSGEYYLQPLAAASWKILEKNAVTAGHSLQLSSGFRSIEEQRQIFNERLSAIGVTPALAKSGQDDSLIDQILATTSVPGFSKHHTGFTIDLVCDGIGLDAFKNTTCYEWLSANNFEQAKLAGWIPSYPDGSGPQGPNPEPWEFVWTGTEILYE